MSVVTKLKTRSVQSGSSWGMVQVSDPRLSQDAVWNPRNQQLYPMSICCCDLHSSQHPSNSLRPTAIFSFGIASRTRKIFCFPYRLVSPHIASLPPHIASYRLIDEAVTGGRTRSKNRQGVLCDQFRQNALRRGSRNTKSLHTDFGGDPTGGPDLVDDGVFRREGRGGFGSCRRQRSS